MQHSLAGRYWWLNMHEQYTSAQRGGLTKEVLGLGITQGDVVWNLIYSPLPVPGRIKRLLFVFVCVIN